MLCFWRHASPLNVCLVYAGLLFRLNTAVSLLVLLWRRWSLRRCGHGLELHEEPCGMKRRRFLCGGPLTTPTQQQQQPNIFDCPER